MPLPPVRQWQSLRQQGGYASCFIGGIFQAPKPLWMLIFIDEAAQSQRTNQSFINKNRAVAFYRITITLILFSSPENIK